MKGIAEFFAKIQNRQAQEALMRKIPQEAIKKHANIDVELADISFKGRALSVKGLGQTAKSQLFLKKKLILEEIANSQLKRVVSDIRF